MVQILWVLPQFITHEKQPLVTIHFFFIINGSLYYMDHHQYYHYTYIHIYIIHIYILYIYISIINPYLHHQQSSREVRASPIAVQDSIRDQFRDSRHLKVMREQLTKGERAPFGEGDKCGSMIWLYYGHIYIYIWIYDITCIFYVPYHIYTDCKYG